MNHVFTSIGTTVSAQGDPALFGVVERVFAALDDRFSLYRPTSEASAIARGDLLLMHSSDEMRAAYALAHDWRVATDGAFQPHRPDGIIDLAGVVKAIAIQQAAAVLARGAGPWLVNAGGDVATSGRAVVGIVDPSDRTKLLSQFVTTPELPAVATSGTSERGEHIWRATSSCEFVQVSVAAPDIVTADVLATAIVAGGTGTLHSMLQRHPIQVLAVTRDGRYVATSAFRASRPREVATLPS